MAIEGIFMFMRIVNIITGVGLIALAIFTMINIFNMVTLKIFLIPSPIFIGFFGFLLIAAELRIKAVLKNLKFLESFFGRGIFNIYLSSVSFWFLQDNEVLAWISAIVLFISGVIYLVFHCGYAKQLRAQYEKEQQKFNKEEEDARNPLTNGRV